MQIYTMKVSKKRIIAFVLLVALIISAVILAFPNRDGVATGSSVSGIRTGDDRLEYITSLGYTVGAEGDAKQVTIPAEFDDIYSLYNSIQQECGFDLEKYAGKTATVHSYKVTNYENEPNALIDLLIFKNKIIGGCVYSTEKDGFMHGLKPRQ